METTVEVPEPNFSEAERTTDLESEGGVTLCCNVCSAEFSAYASIIGADCEIRIDDHPDVHVTTEEPFYSPPDEDDGWFLRDVPEHPHDIFSESHQQLVEFLDTDIDNDGSSLINRMVFAQFVFAFEAYLGDTLINNIKGDAIAIENLAKRKKCDVRLNSPKADESKSLEEKVTTYLASTPHHNVRVAYQRYKTALGVAIFEPGLEWKQLTEAMRLRHDCVHRNGRNSSGQRLEDFTNGYIRDVADLLIGIVNRIEDQISPF